mgnify:CR=1 FL=1
MKNMKQLLSRHLSIATADFWGYKARQLFRNLLLVSVLLSLNTFSSFAEFVAESWYNLGSHNINGALRHQRASSLSPLSTTHRRSSMPRATTTLPTILCTLSSGGRICLPSEFRYASSSTAQARPQYQRYYSLPHANF